MPYAGDKVLLNRNDLLTLQVEGPINTDPGNAAQEDVVSFETASMRDAKETAQAATVRGSRTRDRKLDTLWTCEGEVESVYRGGGVSGAASATAVPAPGTIGAEGLVNLLEAHFGQSATYAAGTTIAACTTTLLKLDVGDGANYTPGDIVTWYDVADAAVVARFVAAVTGDDVSIFPPLAAGQVPAAGVKTYSRRQYRYVDSFTQHPTLFGKFNKGFDGSDAMVCPFGGIVANELTLESPLADLVKLRFGLQGLRAATDPAFGAVAGGLVHPRNPNKPLVGLGQTFAFYCKEGGEIYALRPVNLSLTSSFAAHRTPTLQDQNTSGTHRLGMRDVTASLEVLWDDELIPQNFRAGDRIAFLHVAGRRSEYYHANWSPLAFNAVVFGMPACSIDNVEESENEDEKKLTLSLVGEAGDYGVAQANAEWGWDDELSFCELGSANTA